MLDAALATVDDKSDGVKGRLLRSLLRGEVIDVERSTLAEHEALVEIASWVQDLAVVRLDTDRLAPRLRRRYLIEPFRELVGRPERAPWDASADLVFDRIGEMETLRRHVGVLPPESFGEVLARTADAIRKIFTQSDPTILAITGLGGLGKSTCWRFILDHAFHEGGQLPFAYSDDFDRASLTGREPLSLLLAVTRQVGAELPKAESELSDLRRQIRESLDRFTTGAGSFHGETSEAAVESVSGYELDQILWPVL